MTEIAPIIDASLGKLPDKLVEALKHERDKTRIFRNALIWVAEGDHLDSVLLAKHADAALDFVAHKLEGRSEPDLPSADDVRGLLANCQTCRTTPCRCEIQSSTMCGCGHPENMHHRGGFCCVEIVQAQYGDMATDACDCAKFDAAPTLAEAIVHIVMPFLKDETPVPVVREIVKRLAALVCPRCGDEEPGPTSSAPSSLWAHDPQNPSWKPGDGQPEPLPNIGYDAANQSIGSVCTACGGVRPNHRVWCSRVSDDQPSPADRSSSRDNGS